jgi:hypothetical protein
MRAHLLDSDVAEPGARRTVNDPEGAFEENLAQFCSVIRCMPRTTLPGSCCIPRVMLHAHDATSHVARFMLHPYLAERSATLKTALSPRGPTRQPQTQPLLQRGPRR